MLDCIYDLFHVFDPRVVGATKPNRVNSGIGRHLGNRAVDFGLADVQSGSEFCCLRGVLLVRAPYSSHVSVTDADKGLQVKSGVEAAAYDSNS